MFSEFFKFELRYWLRGWMVYIFVAIITFLFGMAAGSDFVRIGGSIGNTYRNAPYVVAMWYAATGVLTCFMAAAIYDSAASRDFSSKMSDILFSKPIHKWQYLLGRFSAASIIALLPTLGISLGIWTAKIANLGDTERWGPFDFAGHLSAVLIFAIPNTLLFGSIVFAIATVTRNTLYSFLGLLGLLVVYGVAQSVLGELEYELLGALSDPFGAAAYDTATKYWTVEERNTRAIPLTLWLIENRLIWLSVTALIFFLAGRRFSFDVRTSVKKSKSKSKSIEQSAVQVTSPLVATESVLPLRTPQPRWLDQFRSTFISDTVSIVKSTTYIFILVFATLNITLGLFLGNQDFYGLYSFPVTYKMVEQITGSLFIFPVAIVTYFTGFLVWRDRDCRLHEIVGATPVANSVAATSRFFTMLAVIAPIILIGIAAGCLYQVTHGYNNLELSVYFWELFVLQGLRFCFMIVVGLMAHSVSPNKYVGYAAYILFTILNIFLWRWLRWDTLLVRYGVMPSHVYSDMFGFAPYKPALIAFGIYWSSVSVFAIWLTAIIMHRGTPVRLPARFREGLTRSSSVSRMFALGSIIVAVGLGGWLYYNTHVLNELLTASEVENRQVDYERTYEKLADVAQPKITDIKYTIDIYPEDRNIRMQATQTIVNKSDAPIDRLFLNTTPRFNTQVEIPRAKLIQDDARLNMLTYEISPPMQVGESLEMSFTVSSKNRGIENQVSQPQLVQNGTFFNNQISPQFGYDPNRRLQDAKRRKAKELP
ncbi:MAG: ABC transporter permease subunit, partial [Pirellulales bacterium]